MPSKAYRSSPKVYTNISIIGYKNAHGKNAKTHLVFFKALIIGTVIIRLVLGRTLNTVD